MMNYVRCGIWYDKHTCRIVIVGSLLMNTRGVRFMLWQFGHPHNKKYCSWILFCCGRPPTKNCIVLTVDQRYTRKIIPCYTDYRPWQGMNAHETLVLISFCGCGGLANEHPLRETRYIYDNDDSLGIITAGTLKSITTFSFSSVLSEWILC